MLGLLLLAFLVFTAFRIWPKEKGNAAQIYRFSELAATIRLDEQEDREFSVSTNDKVRFHLYKDGSIAFEASDCPDQVCVHTGRISRAGETAACLPNGLLLKIVSEGEGELDAVI